MNVRHSKWAVRSVHKPFPFVSAFSGSHCIIRNICEEEIQKIRDKTNAKIFKRKNPKILRKNTVEKLLIMI